MSDVVDVLIIGGGPAGLACAGNLACQLHTAIVFSHEKFRDDKASRVDDKDCTKVYLPHEEVKSDILKRHSDVIQFKNVEIKSVRKMKRNGQFEAVDTAGNKYRGRKVLLASGITDLMLSLPGYEELWGRSIPYAQKGAPSAGVLAIGIVEVKSFVAVVARMVGRLAGTVNVYTNGAGDEIRNKFKSLLKNTKYNFIDTTIERLEKDPDVDGDAGVLVKLADGSVNKEAFLAHSPYFKLNGSFAEDLGVEVTSTGYINAQSSTYYGTNVKGVFAAGDCATDLRFAAQAITMGNCAAIGLAHSLQAEEDNGRLFPWDG